MSVAYSDASFDFSPELSSPSGIAGADVDDGVDVEERRAQMQKMDADRLVDALRSLRFYTERKLAQLTGGGGGRRGGGCGGAGGGKNNGKIPGRLSSGSESDVGEGTTSDEDLGLVEAGNEGDDDDDEDDDGDDETVELFWSRWDDSDSTGGSTENAATAAANSGSSTSSDAATRHHSLSLGNAHGVNNVMITVKLAQRVMGYGEIC